MGDWLLALTFVLPWAAEPKAVFAWGVLEKVDGAVFVFFLFIPIGGVLAVIAGAVSGIPPMARAGAGVVLGVAPLIVLLSAGDLGFLQAANKANGGLAVP